MRILDLTDKVVLVTGASAGIGEALAEEFVRRGCRVILAARSIEKLEDYRLHLISKYKVADSKVKAIFLDLLDHSTIPAVAHQCIQFHGRIDILVNNAGISFRDEVVNTTLDTYKKVMNVDFFGPVALTKAILPSMIEKGGGSIVTISSLQGKVAIPNAAAYTAAKHAIQAFCDSLRAETAQQNIHVLVASPGYVATQIYTSQLRGDGSLWNPDDRKGVYAKGMSSAYVASKTVEAIIHYEDELSIAPLRYRLLVYLRVLLPSVYFGFAARLRKTTS